MGTIRSATGLGDVSVGLGKYMGQELQGRSGCSSSEVSYWYHGSYGLEELPGSYNFVYWYCISGSLNAAVMAPPFINHTRP